MTAKNPRDPARIFRLPGPADGCVKEPANKTPLSRTKGRIHMHCDNCGIPISKPAAWAKRYIRHFCGDGCRGQGQQINASKVCAYCGDAYAGQRSVILKADNCGKDVCKQASAARRQQMATIAASQVTHWRKR